MEGMWAYGNTVLVSWEARSVDEQGGEWLLILILFLNDNRQQISSN